MRTNIRWAIGMIAAVAALGMTTPTWADNDRGDRGRDHRDGREWRHDIRDRRDDHRDAQWRRAAERREWERRDWERQRAAAHWRFERNHGWRYEARPGFWSPPFVWWRIDGRPVLRPVPTVRVVRYAQGYYELVGDGFNSPYYWVWRPTVAVVAPPPVPLAPPIPPGYDYPSGYYPAPPQG